MADIFVRIKKHPGPCGGALLALVSRQTHFSLISRVLKHIESQYTEKDRSYVTKGEMFEDIVSSLGGRVAEQLILEDISTGASNDLQQATNIARQMITKYGFSERLGPVVYGTSQEETFLGRDFGQGKGYSETHSKS